MHGTLRFPFLSHLLYGISLKIFINESVYFKELHNNNNQTTTGLCSWYKGVESFTVKKNGKEGEYSHWEIAKANRAEWLGHAEKKLDIKVVMNKQMHTKKHSKKKILSCNN